MVPPAKQTPAKGQAILGNFFERKDGKEGRRGIVKGPKQGAHMCGVCGKGFQTPQGLGSHK
jgi:hypothetical protein